MKYHKQKSPKPLTPRETSDWRGKSVVVMRVPAGTPHAVRSVAISKMVTKARNIAG